MRKLFSILAALLTLAASPALAAESAPVQVMVFGTTHFANPNHDVHNVKVDDVLSPRRQDEIRALVDALARFHPTKIVVEDESAEPDLHLPAYEAFTQADLKSQRNERIQLGFRLARQLGLTAVYGVDERSHEGGYDYFPIGDAQAWAQANRRQDVMRAAGSGPAALVKQMGELQANHSFLELAALANDPAALERLHREAYYAMLQLGDAKAQPGAVLNGMWYLRNARIFAKIEQVAKPGDRVLVIFGGGHAYWLRHFAANTPGYALAEVEPLLH